MILVYIILILYWFLKIFLVCFSLQKFLFFMLVIYYNLIWSIFWGIELFNLKMQSIGLFWSSGTYVSEKIDLWFSSLKLGFYFWVCEPSVPIGFRRFSKFSKIEFCWRQIFDVYWIQTKKQKNRQAKYVHRYILCLSVCFFVMLSVCVQ